MNKRYILSGFFKVQNRLPHLTIPINENQRNNDDIYNLNQDEISISNQNGILASNQNEVSVSNYNELSVSN